MSAMNDMDILSEVKDEELMHNIDSDQNSVVSINSEDEGSKPPPPTWKEEDEESDDEALAFVAVGSSLGKFVNDSDVPQAFSHFTYCHTKQKQVV